MRKKLRLGLLPGGANKYVNTLQRCLEFVRESNPSEKELRNWFLKTFRSKSERMAEDYQNTVKSLHLTEEIDSRLVLSKIAKEFLKTRENRLLYHVLDADYVGIHEVLQLLYKKPRTVVQISSLLNKKIEVPWQKGTQWVIRLNWLRSMGYIAKDGAQFRLTREGRKIVESKIKTEERIPEHNELRNRIANAGKLLGYFTQKEYPINDYRVDVAWKLNESTSRPFAVFEVHLKGNIYEALVKLKDARINKGSELFLYTTKNQMAKAEELVNRVFHRIAHCLRILHWTEIDILEKSAEMFELVIVKTMRLKHWRLRSGDMVDRHIRQLTEKRREETKESSS